MGFHVCEYCRQATSSGDVTMSFSTGRTWVMPDMILHYVRDHGYLPPAEFIEDVMWSDYTGGDRAQTRGASAPQMVGYLSGEYESGAVPEGFVEELGALMQRASTEGNRSQTRGL